MNYYPFRLMCLVLVVISLPIHVFALPKKSRCLSLDITKKSKLFRKTVKQYRTTAKKNLLKQKKTDSVKAKQLHNEIVPSKIISIEAAEKKLGYASLYQETSLDSLPILGTVPSWLSGTLFFNGPAQFELNNQPFNFWFDGFAMVHRFHFHNQSVSYANKIINSGYYQTSIKTGKLPVSTGQEKSSFFSKLSNFVSKRPAYDNTNVTMIKMNNQLCALTETPHAMVIDEKTLETKNQFAYNDALEGHVCTPHPIVDKEKNEILNVLTSYGTTSYYHIFSMNQNSNTRNLIASIKSDEPSYLHSFAATENYIILTLIPFRVKPFDLACSSKPFLQNFNWYRDQQTEFVLINRATKKIERNFYSPAFFAFHHVNAFEIDDNTITLDLVRYNDNTIINNMKLSYLRTHDCSKPGQLARYTISLKEHSVTEKQISKTLLENPRINEQYQGTKYDWIYAVDNNDASLLKISVQNNLSLSWQETGCYPNEPVFIANPQARSEDDGVIMSVVLDTRVKKSFILVLDAKTLKECARAYVPHHVPFGFHCTFIPPARTNVRCIGDPKI